MSKDAYFLKSRIFKQKKDYDSAYIYLEKFTTVKDSIFDANNQKLIQELKDQADRGAHYVCALVFVNSADDPEPLIVQTRWYGQIVDQASGNNGFGYDPHFFLKNQNCTAAELDPVQKNLISHRGQALRELITQLKARA